MGKWTDSVHDMLDYYEKVLEDCEDQIELAHMTIRAAPMPWRIWAALRLAPSMFKCHLQARALRRRAYMLMEENANRMEERLKQYQVVLPGDYVGQGRIYIIAALLDKHESRNCAT